MSIFNRLAVFLLQNLRYSERIRSYSRSRTVIRGHRSWCQSKAHMRLPGSLHHRACERCYRCICVRNPVCTF